MRLMLILFFSILLQACQATDKPQMPRPTLPQLNYAAELFDGGVPAPEDFYQLSAAQIKSLNEFVAQEHIASLPRYKQAYAYLKKRLVNFNFQGENYSATESLENNGGNCMALAMLTYAIAKEMDVEFRFQVMHTMPVLLDISDEIAVTSDHVRTFLYEASEDESVALFGRSRVQIDYFPDKYDRGGKLINQEEFLAMFYRNLAADAIFIGDLNYAFLLLNKSLKIAPYYEPAINMQAVVLRKLGDEESAEKLYRYGLEIAENKITLLSNYHFLLELDGRAEQADRIKQQLLALEDQSPYTWYLQALDAMSKQDYKSAKVYLNKFLQNTHYYHRAYYDLAKVQVILGEYQLAEESLALAMKYTERTQDRSLYQTKIDRLSNL
ncbi:tetratricopeptide repeat protein [Shewanella sp. 10N.261.52.F9]|uniref:tetratricopeptide repeat protein n=1 Tax=Shewanella sp. 10N.261.52.F9 TaxID=3229684 RepID=UPI00354F5528